MTESEMTNDIASVVAPPLLADDFSDGNFAGWQVVDEGTVSAPSAWAVVSGALQQSSNIQDGDMVVAALPKKGTFAWYTQGLGWSNYTVAVQMWSTDNDTLGVMVRYQNPNNYYRFSWDAQRTYRRLVKVVNGSFTLLAQDAVPYVTWQSYQVEVVANGTSLEVRVDGVPLFGGPVVDGALSTGSVALYSWGNSRSVFDHVLVSPVVVPLPPDDGAIKTIAFPESGVYDVRLVETDAQGVSDTTPPSRTITVRSKTGPRGVIKSPPGPMDIYEQDTVEFQATPHADVTYQWLVTKREEG